MSAVTAGPAPWPAPPPGERVTLRPLAVCTPTPPPPAAAAAAAPSEAARRDAAAATIQRALRRRRAHLALDVLRCRAALRAAVRAAGTALHDGRLVAPTLALGAAYAATGDAGAAEQCYLRAREAAPEGGAASAAPLAALVALYARRGAPPSEAPKLAAARGALAAALGASAPPPDVGAAVAAQASALHAQLSAFGADLFSLKWMQPADA